MQLLLFCKSKVSVCLLLDTLDFNYVPPNSNLYYYLHPYWVLPVKRNTAIVLLYFDWL